MFVKIKLAVQRHTKELGRVRERLRLHFLFQLNMITFVFIALMGSSLVCPPSVSRISAVYPPYVCRLSAVEGLFVSRISAVYQQYVHRMSAVYPPNVSHT